MGNARAKRSAELCRRSATRTPGSVPFRPPPAPRAQTFRPAADALRAARPPVNNAGPAQQKTRLHPAAGPRNEGRAGPCRTGGGSAGTAPSSARQRGGRGDAAGALLSPPPRGRARSAYLPPGSARPGRRQPRSAPHRLSAASLPASAAAGLRCRRSTFSATREPRTKT